MTQHIPPPPKLKHLNGNNVRIEVLRDRVSPILSNRVLAHFTDHSVTHSDRLTEVVDLLIEPLQATEHALNEQELVILYSACYLHDIGMQYENAGGTEVIRNLNLTTQWENLSEHDRRTILRENHHLVSAEMVMESVRAEKPVIGIQLTEEYKPKLLAALCAAQNLPVDSPRYEKLTQDSPGIRMRLLSGFLRLADILEESRRRATRDQARTLLLDLESQTHWWRHYYVEDVTIEPPKGLVTVWFDFPAERRVEYGNIVPQLQIPWVEKEFNYHAPIFHKYGFGWSLSFTVQQTAYSDAEAMPDSVLSEMLRQLMAQRDKEDAERRVESLEHFRRSRPSFDRRISDLHSRKEVIGSGEYLTEAAEIAMGLWNIGSQRSAMDLLSSSYTDEARKSLPHAKRLVIAIQFARMASDQNDPRRAFAILNGVKESVEELPSDDDTRFVFWKSFASTLAALLDYDQALLAFQKAIECAPDASAHLELEMRLAEFRLLSGNLDDILETMK